MGASESFVQSGVLDNGDRRRKASVARRAPRYAGPYSEKAPDIAPLIRVIRSDACCAMLLADVRPTRYVITPMTLDTWPSRRGACATPLRMRQNSGRRNDVPHGDEARISSRLQTSSTWRAASNHKGPSVATLRMPLRSLRLSEKTNRSNSYRGDSSAGSGDRYRWRKRSQRLSW